MGKVQTYVGRIATVRSGEQFGFIGIDSVRTDKDRPHKLDTTEDIFVHQDDCDATLTVGLEVGFNVKPDKSRGDGTYRAFNVAARETVRGELVLAGFENMPLADPRSFYVPPTETQRRAKQIPREEVEAVLNNMPMPRMPRERERPKNLGENLGLLADSLFPQFASMGTGAADIANGKFDELVRQSIEQHNALNMKMQAVKMQGHAQSYKLLHLMSQDKEQLLLPETVIPIEYLPDLFMAAPVWYFWSSGTAEEEKEIARARQPGSNANVPRHLAYMCNLVPNQRWADTFLLFNHSLRTLKEYDGDLIPLTITARMQKLAGLLDYMVIMTPYHDVVAEDWSNPQWLRNVDPYVVGFAKGVPFMFMIGRFSDSGVFPLYSELVADTIMFIRGNLNKLKIFNTVYDPQWHYAKNVTRRTNYSGNNHEAFGSILITHLRQLLAAFDRGELFDWLRGEEKCQRRHSSISES